jgi:hypothetical protein
MVPLGLDYAQQSKWLYRKIANRLIGDEIADGITHCENREQRESEDDRSSSHLCNVC